MKYSNNGTKSNLSILLYRNISLEFIKRDISMQYKGSYLGFFWSFLNPLFMLVIYTFVFGFVFKQKWNIPSSNQMMVAFILFSGLIPFNLFSGVFARAPGLIINNANYVKKVVFPLEIFPIMAMGTSVFNALISYLILVIGVLIFLGKLYWTMLLFPIVLIPIILLSIGLGWFISSLGVFLRDIGQIINIMVSAIMFLTPIFYPLSSIPKPFLPLYNLNPIAPVVDNMRTIVIWGQTPDWNTYFVDLTISSLIALAGFWWFQKTKKGFSDVL
ncbi:ABC transporter permease [Alicyclobacillus tolerans]|uniref:ABC transporter permease n=1 Tax=Alicyclobacillus tolerans TaxID=90970 RepID=UPI001F2B7106|nr:ABC transporter permease [Alicyclobacillus tolerans]MCF8567859.1 ABC transporter permease [Alicyclobacillus tolerans]